MRNDIEHRRINLRELIEQWGGPGALGEKLGYQKGSFLVQMAGPHPTREVSERTARKIEATLGLPKGWMDEPHDGDRQAASAVSIDVVADTIRMVGQACEDSGLKLTPSKFADLVAMVYVDAMEAGAGKPRQSYALRLIQLVK